MAKVNITQYDATAANNTDIDSVNIGEGCAPSGINNAIRELMAHLADLNAGNVALGTIKVDNLQLDANAITSTDTNGDIAITPNGTGDVVIDGLKHPQADGSAGQFLKTDGSGQLAFATVDTTVADGAITIGKMADDSVGAAELVDNSVGAAAINISGNGTAGQVIVSDGDGSFSYADSSSPFSPTTASGTTPTLNLASHNFFDLGRLSGNTTLAFSNIPTAKRWFVDVEGSGSYGGTFAVSGNFTQSNTNPNTQGNDGTVVGTSSQTTGDNETATFGNNGTKFYVFGQHSSQNVICEYDLSTAYDINSATFNGTSGGLNGSIGAAFPVHGGAINSDGTKIYIMVNNSTRSLEEIHQYTMSTPYDVTTLGSHTEIDVQSGEENYHSLNWRANGTQFHVYSKANNKFKIFTVSSAFDISTVSATAIATVTDNKDFDVMGAFLNADGTELVMLDLAGRVNHAPLSTPYDVTTIGAGTTPFLKDLCGDDLDIGVSLDPNGTQGMGHIVMKTTPNFEFVTQKVVTPFTLTMPAAVKNSDYLPDVDADDQYLLEFNTTDGGTNIWKTAHVKYDDN